MMMVIIGFHCTCTLTQSTAKVEKIKENCIEA